MDKIVRGWIAEILKQNEPLVKIAVRQRAKFEGWLKFELASLAEQKGAHSVKVESFQDSSRKRADVSFIFNNTCYDIELKTPNTNWRIPGVLKSHGPITKNVKGIVGDAEKLRNSPNQGIVAFVMFPIPNGDTRWVGYLTNISNSLKLQLTPQANSEQVGISLENGDLANLVICSFLVLTDKV